MIIGSRVTFFNKFSHFLHNSSNSLIFPEVVIDRNPLDHTTFDLSIDPVLDSSEISDGFQMFKRVHIEEIIPNIMHMIDMSHKIFSPSLKQGSICKADVAFAKFLMEYFLLDIPLFSKFVDDDSCNDVA